jgi:hypothetical protein
LTSGWILIAVGLLIIAALSVTRSVFLADLGVSDQSWQAVIYDTLTRFLQGLGRTSVALGVVAVLAALLAGPARFAVALRRGVMGLAKRIADPLANAVPSITGAGRVVSSALAIFGGIIVAIGTIALLWGREASAGRIVWIVVLALIAWFIVLVIAATASSPVPAQPAVETTNDDAVEEAVKGPDEDIAEAATSPDGSA